MHVNNKGYDMRQIKFRAWHIKDKEMLGHKDACLIPLFTPSFRYRDGETVLMQYTGLKDRNGVEIYEGDVLTTWILGCKQTAPYIVEDIRELYLETERDESYYCINKMEIIGNIHSHPELLEKK